MDDTPDWASINPRVVSAFRADGGHVGGPWEKSPLLLLHTVGARSRQAYVNPLTYLLDDGRYVVFASNYGAAKNPGWYHNVIADPDVVVEVGTRIVRARATVATGARRDELYRRQVQAFARFGEYEEKTERLIPVVVLTPSHE